MTEDWEIGQLYWNCLRSAKQDGAENEEHAEQIALQKVKERYFNDFEPTKTFISL